MSFTQYKKFWEENKKEILANLKNNRFYAIEKSEEYYKKIFKLSMKKSEKRKITFNVKHYAIEKS